MRQAQGRGTARPHLGHPHLLTPMRRLRRPSGLSSGSTPGLGASPEMMPGSLAESFWGREREGHSQGLCASPQDSCSASPSVWFSPLRSRRTGRGGGSLGAWYLQTESMVTEVGFLG